MFNVSKIIEVMWVDKQRASTVYICKWWANDKAVWPPYTSWHFKTAKAVLLQVHRILVYNDERSAWERCVAGA